MPSVWRLKFEVIYICDVPENKYTPNTIPNSSHPHNMHHIYAESKACAGGGVATAPPKTKCVGMYIYFMGKLLASG